MAYPKRAKKLLAEGRPLQTGGSSKMPKAPSPLPAPTGSPLQRGGSSKMPKAPSPLPSGMEKMPEMKVAPPPKSPYKAPKVTGRANALTRGKGNKIGLKRIESTISAKLGVTKAAPPAPARSRAKADVSAKAAATQRAKTYVGEKHMLAASPYKPPKKRPVRPRRKAKRGMAK